MSSDENDLQLLAKIISTIGAKDLAEDFILDFLSAAEISDLAERWRIVEKVAEGIPQRQVRDELSVSLAKVSRSAQILKSDRQSFKKIAKLIES
ncbi:MAG: Trp family transcriptional regulator [Bdellovibrionales bacterium]